MTALVSVQNMMSHENEDLHALASSNMAENNGAESKLTAAHENMDTTSQPSLQSMGLQPEAEEDEEPQQINISPKGSAKRKSEHRSKGFCETLLGNVNSQQKGAIARISTPDGLENMHKWLLNAKSDTQSTRLCNLLAQCWGASMNSQILKNIKPIVNLMREFKQHTDKDVRTAASEVIKKWRNQASKLEESLVPAKTSKDTVSKPVQSTAASSIPAKPSTSVPVSSTVPAKEKSKSINRPKTARTKDTKFRKTGFEEDEEEDGQPPLKKTVPPGPSRLANSLTKPIIPKKPVNAVLSDSFKNAMSSGTSNAVELQRKRKKHPPVIDPLNPLTSAVPIVMPALLSANLHENHNGPDPSRVPPADGKKRIHFADDKGEQLVYIQWIENVLHNKNIKSSDMKHADAEAERKSLKQAKPGFEEEEEDEELRANSARRSGSFDDAIPWQAVPYCIPTSKDFNEELIAEETQREERVMMTFSQPNVPIERPAEPENTSFTFTKSKTPESIPKEFAPDDGVEPEQPMEVDEVDAPASPEASPAPAQVFQHPPPPAVISPAPTSTAQKIEILPNFDIHGGSKPVPFPHALPFSGPPSNFSLFEKAPQPVPPPAEELVILADHPNNLPRTPIVNTAELKNILSKFGKKPSNDSAAAVPVSEQNCSQPPPGFQPHQQNASIPTPTPVSDFVEVQMDVHAGGPINQGPRPSMPFQRPQQQQRTQHAPGSSGKICPFFPKGTCSFHDRCHNIHANALPPQQVNPFRHPGPRYANHRGEGNNRGRYQNSNFNRGAYNSSNFNSSGMQDHDNYNRSDKKFAKRHDDYRGGSSNRHRTSRSPSPRRRRISRSPDRFRTSRSPERYRRRRSRSSSSEKEGYSRRSHSPARRRRSPSPRSPSRSPISSPSPKN